MIWYMFPGLDLCSTYTDPAQHLITAGIGSAVDDLDDAEDPEDLEDLDYLYDLCDLYVDDLYYLYNLYDLYDLDRVLPEVWKITVTCCGCVAVCCCVTALLHVLFFLFCPSLLMRYNDFLQCMAWTRRMWQCATVKIS